MEHSALASAHKIQPLSTQISNASAAEIDEIMRSIVADLPELDDVESAKVWLGTIGDITAAYVGNHEVDIERLPQLIGTVATALTGSLQAMLVKRATSTDSGVVKAAALGIEPAVPIEKSIQEDHLVCLEDGHKFRMLKRHLRMKYNLSPQQYRERWGLPDDYPMTAPGYSKKRSEMARSSGLGKHPGTGRPKSTV